MLYNKIEKRDYTALKNAGKGYTLEAELQTKNALCESVENDVDAPVWALPKAKADRDACQARYDEFFEKTGTPKFDTLTDEEKDIVMLSLGIKVEKFEAVVKKVANAQKGADLKDAAKDVTGIMGKKVLAYEVRNKKNERVPLIEVWECMKYSGLKIKKAGLRAVERKESSYLKEARKYVAFCILG